MNPKNNQTEQSSNNKILAYSGAWRIAVGVIIAVVLLILIISTLSTLALIFVSVLIAVLLYNISTWISQHTPLSYHLALGVVLVGLVLLIGITVWVFGPDIAAQLDELVKNMPQALDEIETQLRQYEWGKSLLDQIPQNIHLSQLLAGSNTFSQITGVFSSTLGALFNFAFVLFIGLYVAIEPSIYVDSFIRLFPKKQRDRVRDALNASGDALQRWLLARFLSMLVVGIFTWVGLELLSVPLAIVLALIAGLLSFIPNIGPILSVIPAVLVAWVQSPQLALFVILLYIGVQFLESNFITPLIERNTAYLPPGLVMSMQLILTVLIGRLGLLLAAPLMAVSITLVHKLYIEDILDDHEQRNDA